MSLNSPPVTEVPEKFGAGFVKRSWDMATTAVSTFWKEAQIKDEF